jgi:hypothetical protein
MVNPRQVVRPLVFALLLSMFSAASVSVAHAQFTLTVSSPFSPPEVDPGGTAIATLDIEPNGSSNPVTLTCVVTASNQQTISLPSCDPSPTSPITPPAKPSLTVTTTAVPPNPPVPPGSYIMTVTGTDGTNSQTLTLSLTIVDVTEDYTLSASPTIATPGTVAAGAIATTTVTITPIGSYSNHQVTLACLSVSPVVTAAPICSFTPTNATSPGPVQVTSGPATATLTITTLGPTPTTRLRSPRIFYALWLLVPGLGLVAAGRSGNRSKRLMGLLLLMTIASSVLLMPACSHTNNTNNPNGETTPNNTYTFTLTGADENGNGPGNTITCTPGVACGAATVTLTVN